MPIPWIRMIGGPADPAAGDEASTRKASGPMLSLRSLRAAVPVTS
ncbi:hypothetical protein [Microbacterium sp. CFBP9034]|nr:hypothetical protein [Microbacterium sp. CFBP9034]MDY0908635.1 hypothetical protein [Microbacterium sp. CFBP9034]